MTEEKAEETVDALALLKSRRRRHEAVQQNTYQTHLLIENYAWSPEVESRIKDLLREEAAREFAEAQAALDAL